MKKGAKRRKALPGEGMWMEFHGSFTTQAAADKRARAKHGFYVKRRVNGRVRYVVMRQKESPF